MEKLRRAMRQVPSSVAVVTATGGGEARGITVGSLTSVSLQPPLISFNVSIDCRMHPVIMAADRFNVNVLADSQADVSRTFAEPDKDGAAQLSAVPYVLDDWGVPVLSGIVALMKCVAWARHEAGDHILIIGRVENTRMERNRAPLVYLDRGYHGMGRRIGSQDWPI